MSPKLIALFSALSLSAAALPAKADQVSFSFNENQLETAAGANALYKNLTARAERLCRTPGRRPIEQMRVEEKCTEGLVEDFVEAIDNRRLSSIHAAATERKRYASRR